MKQQLGLRVNTQLRAGSTKDITQNYKDCFEGCYQQVINGTYTYDACMSQCLGEESSAGGTSVSQTFGIVL